MAKTKIDTNLEDALANAAAQLAKADNIDDAERWQGIVNQTQAAIDKRDA